VKYISVKYQQWFLVPNSCSKVKSRAELGLGQTSNFSCAEPNANELRPQKTVPDPLGHDIKFNSFKTSVPLKTTDGNITEFNNN
jgi:hypothetical protein